MLPKPGDHVLYIDTDGRTLDALVVDTARGAPETLTLAVVRVCGVVDFVREVEWRAVVGLHRRGVWCWPVELGTDPK